MTKKIELEKPTEEFIEQTIIYVDDFIGTWFEDSEVMTNFIVYLKGLIGDNTND